MAILSGHVWRTPGIRPAGIALYRPTPLRKENGGCISRYLNHDEDPTPTPQNPYREGVTMFSPEWIPMMGVIYMGLVAAVVIYLLLLAFRFVRAVERFVEKYSPR